MNWILILFILLTIIVGITWRGKYQLSLILFCIFLVCATLFFALDITQKLSIQL